MKKILSLLAAALLLFGAACAEALPYDFTPGPVAAEENYQLNDDGTGSYRDESLIVIMERTTVGDANFNVATVMIRDVSQLRTYTTGEKKTDRISTLAKNCNAVVAIGGEYYTNGKAGFIVRMGEVLRFTPYQKRDFLIVDSAGDFHFWRAKEAYGAYSEDLKAAKKQYKRNADVQAAAASAFIGRMGARIDEETGTTGRGIGNVFNFGPVLVWNGEVQAMPKDYQFNLTGKEPRCAIGQVTNDENCPEGWKEYKLVVVDGRRKDSNGCTAAVLAQFMADIGCSQAYNLDGGNSALMVFHGENFSEKSVSAERSVSDIIYFATAVGGGQDKE